MRIVNLIPHALSFKGFTVKRAINTRNTSKPRCLSKRGATAGFWKWPMLGKINLESIDRVHPVEKIRSIGERKLTRFGGPEAVVRCTNDL